jgi:hypothetical protein
VSADELEIRTYKYSSCPNDHHRMSTTRVSSSILSFSLSAPYHRVSVEESCQDLLMSIVFRPPTKGHMCIQPLLTNVTSSLSRRCVARRIYPTEVNLSRLLMYTRIFESTTNYQGAIRCFYYVAKRVKQEHDGPSHTQLYLIQMYTYSIQHKPSRTITPALQQSSHMPTTAALRVSPRSSLQTPQTFP